MEEMRNAYTMFVAEFEGKKPCVDDRIILNK
jgi:hypothetical protein